MHNTLLISLLCHDTAHILIADVYAVIMNNEPYKLREIFSKDMNGTHEILYIADKLVQ